MAEKVKRLSKVARELNVGISTIVEFLSSKNVNIESSPNTKIEPDVYDLLLNEFGADLSVKEKAKATVIKREKRETISLKDSKDEEESDDEDVEEVEVESVKEEPAKVTQVEEDVKPKVQVIGKIDLDSINQKTRPEKKKEEPVTPKEEPVKEEPVKEEKPVVQETKTEETPKKEEEDVETIKVQTKKLSGPTVVGKIELPAERERSKPSSSDDDSADGKRKRKRIKKVNVEKQAKFNKQNPPKQQGGKKKIEKAEVSEADIQKEVKETLARLSGQGGKSKAAKLRREKRESIAAKKEEELMKAEAEKNILKLSEFVTVSELASMMSVSPTEVISTLMSIGIFASINQRLDAETITMVAEDYGYATEFVSAEVQESIPVVEDQEDELKPRPPIVTVMGHVDHGKTSLLDYVRNADVTSGEAGGITQHIGAYQVKLKDGNVITFLDTPGHEAFTAMRARGANVTDVAIIIIAADDNVMPQTKEAISHAQAAGVPMVFAINKIDVAGANPDRIREELSTMNILVEDWGGKYQCQEISAKKGTGVDELLEKVLLEAEMLDLKANPDKNALGTVIESSLDKGRGYVTTVLVEAGTLRVGDIILAGRFYGKVKAMQDERGKRIKEVGPSGPVSILGLNGSPSAGDKFHIFDDEKEAKTIANKREQLFREQGLRTQKHITLDEIGRRLAIGDFQELNVIVKGDVDGSVEALSDSLLKLSTDQIQVNIVHKGVGQISESDVLLATASDAIIIGFQVRPSASARKLAENEEIDIRMYSVIYKAIEEIKSAMEGMLSPDIEEKITGSAEIRETFKISKVGTIAGCFVTEGNINRNSNVRIIRDGIVIYTGELGSLKRFKDDVKEVKHGYECGLNIDKFNDIKVGDVVEAFEEVEVEKKL
ncbi:MAG: translation initiation factor IF-2 [Crocinitomicaceae bacterium]|nr:translation initiation factor IF-2 [Crocinitomicaceae bacterium]